MPEGWPLILNEPGVFTGLINSMGLSDIQAEELYEFKYESWKSLSPVYGIIFMYPWAPNTMDDSRVLLPNECDFFFAKQVATNSCATQALLSVLMNLPATVDLPPLLKRFKDFAMPLTAEGRGLAIQNSTELFDIHCSMARPPMMTMEQDTTTESNEESFHFVAFVPIDGKLYELDGLKLGPVCLGDIVPENEESEEDCFLRVVAEEMTDRIRETMSSTLSFSMMAVCKDILLSLKEKLDVAKDANDEAVIAELEFDINEEEMRREQWSNENIRRKHNYIPFLIQLLKLMSEKGELEYAVNRARGMANHAANHAEKILRRK
ncbi:hypothetical protein PCE1_000697 [Barthelona sp. PCE]